ncbi:MAG TPA: hypothetical protein VF116_13020 [Ktedonobacterales bacterium]
MSSEDRRDDLNALKQRALWALEHAAERDPAIPADANPPSARLWQYPSFGSYVSWTLFAPKFKGDAGRCMVRRVIWDQMHDLARFADPLEGIRQGFRAPPTILVADARVSIARFEHVAERFALCPIPVLGIEAPFGLDGDSYGLETFDLFLRIRLEWWDEGPRTWGRFVATLADFRQELDAIFA